MSFFETLISQIQTPKSYISFGENCYICPIRNQLIPITPEETVRQKVIKYLMSYKAVPENLLKVGIKLSEYYIRSTSKADIFIHKYSGREEELSPLAIVECKAPNFMIDDSTVKKATNYAQRIGASYIFVTNGMTFVAAKYQAENNKWVRIEELPNYNAMVGGMRKYILRKSPARRIPFTLLKQYKYAYRGNVFNYDTPAILLPFLTNLLECLLDTLHTIPEKQYRRFRIIKDYGIRQMACGNAGGYGYYGSYRSFLVENDSGVMFMSMSIFDYGNHTIINASIDRYINKPHNSLQYSVDLLKIAGNEFTFNHNASITIGKNGAGKTAELKKFVEQEAPELLVDGEICLGKLTNNRLFYLSDPEVVQLVENILTYAIVRDKFREMKLANSNQSLFTAGE